MTASTTRDPRSPVKVDRQIAWALALSAFVLLWVTEAQIGFPRDESVYFAAADAIARWLRLLVQSPSVALTDGTLSSALDFNHEHPLFMKTLFALSSMLFRDTLGWVRPAAAYRIPAFAVGALIPAVLHLFGSSLYGRKAGLFAALSFFAVPRHFFHAHLACFDVPIAAFWLLTVYLYWRAQTDRWCWLYCGLAFGVAISSKHNGLFLPLVLAPFSLFRAEWQSRKAPQARATFWAFIGLYAAAAALMLLLVASWGETEFLNHFFLLSPPTGILLGLALGTCALLVRLRAEDEATFRSLAPVGAMALLGPALFYLHWPYLWPHPVDRTAWYLNFHATHVHYAWMYLGRLLRQPPFPLEYVFVVTALTVPLSLGVAMVAGGIALVLRLVAGLRRGAQEAGRRLSEGDALVGVHALTSILIISHPSVPHFGGVKHWLPSMCFLALLAGDAVARAGRTLASRLPPRLPAHAAFAGLALLVLLPAVTETAHGAAFGTSLYGELAGGMPGAASLGMQRQYWSNNVSGVLPFINETAPRGARLWLHEVNGYSFHDYQLNGMLRPDLQMAGGPADADMAAYQYHQEFREQEMNIWQAFGTSRPVYGLYLDQTPQVMVYRRP